MKNVFFAISLLSILLFTVGCPEPEKEYFEKGSVAPQEYKSSPMVIRLTSSPDFTFPQGTYVPKETGEVVLSAGGWMSGYATSIYHIDKDKSHFAFKEFTLGSNPYQLTSTFVGMLTQENGDSFRYNSVIFTQLLRSTFTGTIKIDGGTGKYEYCYGLLNITGDFLPNGECT